MRGLIWILALGLAGLAVQAQAQEQAQERPPERRITVTGEASVEAAPDMARITLGVSFEAREARAAVDAVSRAMADSLEQLAALGVAARDIQTRGLTLYPVQPDRPRSDDSGPERMAGFHAANTVIVRVRDLEALGGLLDAVLEAGATQFGGLSFDVQDPEPLIAEARRRAVADARARAELLAEAAGVTLGPVLTIADQGAGTGGGMEMMAARRGGGVPVAPGEVSVTASVSVVFAIAD